MKREIVLTIILLFFSCIMYSQTTFSFDYDANGNRIQREIIVISSKMAYSENSKDSITDESSINVIEKDDIKIYPNPTKGILKVELKANSNIDKMQINIINIKGQIVYKTNQLQNTYTIDLSLQPQGAYILIVVVNDKKYDWRIIKE